MIQYSNEEVALEVDIVAYGVIMLALILPCSHGAVKVLMKNDLFGGEALQIHCKDKHHDFGVHVLQSGNIYDLQIKPWADWAPFADYYCGMYFHGRLHWFDIYLWTRDVFQCGRECVWLIRNQGPCFQDSRAFVACYPWN